MKKILFLVRKNEPDNQFFIETAKKMGIDFYLCEHDDLVVSYKENRLSISVLEQKLESFDLIYIRNVGRYRETLMLVAEYCKKHKIAIFDPVFSFNEPWIDTKSFQYAKLENHNIPLIKSLFVSEKNTNVISREFSYPCVVKDTEGREGQGVHLCNSEKEVITVFQKYNKKLLVQEFIKNDGDLRIFIIGDEVIGTIKRSAKGNEFRNNVALGGSASKYEIDKNLEKMAIKITKLLNFSITGLDMIFDSREQKWKVMEVNRGPKFKGFMATTGINIPEKILNFLVKQIS